MNWLGVTAGVLMAVAGGRSLWVLRRAGDVPRKRTLTWARSGLLVAGLGLAVANVLG